MLRLPSWFGNWYELRISLSHVYVTSFGIPHTIDKLQLIALELLQSVAICIEYANNHSHTRKAGPSANQLARVAHHSRQSVSRAN